MISKIYSKVLSKNIEVLIQVLNSGQDRILVYGVEPEEAIGVLKSERKGKEVLGYRIGDELIASAEDELVLFLEQRMVGFIVHESMEHDNMLGDLKTGAGKTKLTAKQSIQFYAEEMAHWERSSDRQYSDPVQDQYAKTIRWMFSPSDELGPYGMRSTLLTFPGQLTFSGYQKLMKNHNISDGTIREYMIAIHEHGKRYQTIYSTINNWLRNARTKPGSASGVTSPTGIRTN